MSDTGLVADFVRDWGYLAVFLGSIVEGEVVLLTASAFAASGYLSIYKIFAIAFTTTVIVDQALFLVGYKVGTDWLITRCPGTKKLRDRAFALLNKMDVFFIIAFRFIYGIRTISPLIIGSAKIRPLRFVGFNIVSGFFWALAGCGLGYLVADVIVDGKFDTMPTMIAISLIIAIISIISVIIMKVKQENNEK